MEPYSLDPKLVVVVLAAMVAAVMFLRVLAIYRQHEIDHHDLIREVKRARAEYDRKISNDNDEIIV